MPNQARSGIRGVPWHRCDVCGRDRRVSDLIVQKGLLVCRFVSCQDDPAPEMRGEIIRQKMENYGPEPDLADILKHRDQGQRPGNTGVSPSVPNPKPLTRS